MEGRNTKNWDYVTLVCKHRTKEINVYTQEEADALWMSGEYCTMYYMITKETHNKYKSAGFLHRLDGPAAVCSNRNNVHYVWGVEQ